MNNQKSNYIEDFRWSTEEPHSDNIETMNDYLDVHMPTEWKLLVVEGTYAEIKNNEGNFAVHASGDGNCYNHRITFEEI